jgi:TusA-related sulfurtransferase
MTLSEIKSGSDNEIVVLVDTDTSKENVSRAAVSQGCTIQNISPDGEGYKITVLRK